MVYDETSLARRRLLHGRAAAAPLDTAIVARHLQLAGRDDEAAREYVRAAAHAGAVFAHAEAVGHLRSALALGHPERSTLHMSLGQLQTLQGDYAGALSSYETAAATATPTELSGIEHRLGQVHHRRGEWALAQARFQAALDAGSSRDVAARARITADLSLAAHAGGDSARAAKLAAAACSLAERAADTRALAQAHNLLGLLASSTGDSAAAVRHLQSSLALAEHVDDPGARVAALNNLALTHRGSGELAAAIRLTRSALDGCALLGDRHREAALHNNLADLLHITGETDQAMEHLKRAVSLFADVGADEGPQPEVWKLVQW
ncbi:MAG: tetratricopeptide repeat protein [Geodermatophilaceae bacterium]